MGRTYAGIYGLAGEPLADGTAFRLSAPLRATGFWVVNVPGATFFTIRRSEADRSSEALPTHPWVKESQWRDRLTLYLGYGVGIPEGEYIVELLSSTQVSLGKFSLKITSGKVTQSLQPLKSLFEF